MARNVFPLVGGRNIEHLYSNIKSLKIRFTEDQIKPLEPVKPIDIKNVPGPEARASGLGRDRCNGCRRKSSGRHDVLVLGEALRQDDPAKSGSAVWRRHGGGLFPRNPNPDRSCPPARHPLWQHRD